MTSRGAIITDNLNVGNVNFLAYAGGISTGTIGTAVNPSNSVFLHRVHRGGRVDPDESDRGEFHDAAGGQRRDRGHARNTGCHQRGESGRERRQHLRPERQHHDRQYRRELRESRCQRRQQQASQPARSTAAPDHVPRNDPTILRLQHHDRPARCAKHHDCRPLLLPLRRFRSSARSVRSSPVPKVSIGGSTISVGAITLDPLQQGTVNINASGTLTLNGDITTGTGSSITISSNNPGVLQFSKLDAGSGSVAVTNPNGIQQGIGAPGITGGVR